MKKVLVSGYIGFNNFGDEAIFKALREHLQSLNVKVYALSASDNYDIKTYNYKSIVEIIKAILSCDILISGGGSLLQNKTSNSSLIYYLSVIILAKLFFKKVIIFAQGIEPIKGKLFEFITKNVLKCCDFITTRDKKSSDLLANWGIKSETLSDPIYSILPEINKDKNGLIVQLRECALNVLDELARAIQENYNGEISVLALQDCDVDICKKFVEKLKKNGINSDCIYDNNVEQTIKLFNNAKYVISTRLHGLMVSNALGAHVFALSYDDKTQTVIEEFQLENINLKNPINLNEKISYFFQNQRKNTDYRKFSFSKIDEVINEF